ncbi:MAG: hypothetical protein DRN53_02280 [Thermoprotei archaeon]|nr:MAG: hypothetical protein DRN53_02280 [Thermoprotei archaeon]
MKRVIQGILLLLSMSIVNIPVKVVAQPKAEEVLKAVLGPIRPYAEIGLALLFGAAIIAFIVFIATALGNWIWGGPFGKLMAMSSLWRAITVLAVIGIVFLVAYNIGPVAKAFGFSEAEALGSIVTEIVNRGFGHIKTFFTGT